ncbi:FAD-dependent oxidoreductase [Streptomyces thinghirensis]|uniref:NAD(P)/FAD-dependent oxidoreductase n=1 Tax=Streptomyces thinghirensis TaxID=551547 RepID=A0ABP9T7C0_9ACTN
MPHRSVVVAGCGPVGLLTALGLAEAGVDVTVLEAMPRITAAPHDMVYPWAVLPGIERLGLLEDMRRAGLTVREWCFKVLRTGERIVFDLDTLADEVAHPYQLHLPQHLLTDIVTKRLNAISHARVEWGTSLTGLRQDGHGVTVTTKGADGARTIRAGWLVGADGAHSQVRRALGLGFAGLTWPMRFVSTDLRFDLSTLGFSETGYQLDLEHGALVARADRSGLWRYVYAESRALPDETIPDRLPAVFKSVLPEGADPLLEGWSAYRVHERVAERFRVGRVMLAGDAAHVTNPTGAHGLACGLFDAFVLTEALAAVVHGQADDAVLDRYARERRRVFLDSASPLSSESMRLVFHADSEPWLDKEIARYRSVAVDPELRRDHLLLSGDMRSTSVL